MSKKSTELKTIVEMPFHGDTLSIESGWVAKQADGAVVVRHGDTMLLVTVCSAPARPDQNFFPMVVEYKEKGYAAGKIPGGFFKREGRPGESEILTCRLVDRPIRPLFEDGYMDETQIICTVMSADMVNPPDVLAICGASAALHISPLPFLGPIGGVRVGRIGGKLLINPSNEEMAKSELDLVVAGTNDSIVMVEGAIGILPEKEVLDALYFGHDEIKKICAMQEDLKAKVGKEKREFDKKEVDPELVAKVKEVVLDKLPATLDVHDKHERSATYKEIVTNAIEELEEQFPEMSGDIKEVSSELLKKVSREKIIRDQIRIGDRKFDEVRFIECDTGIVPRAHGSALFTRGETQSIVTTTLGTGQDAQRMDTLTGDEDKTFMLHYNFPPFSTGEARMLRGTSRRETGHGMLAERAIRPVLPQDKDFPYVIRIVSEVTESNGSSSMASVCGGVLSLMDAGIQISAPVAGVAMGLIKEGDDVAILTDILGDEDHFGDMDFKVCGTSEGITALQMDIKCKGLARETMEQALNQALEARLHILGEMNKALDKPREKMSKYAPSIVSFKINPDKIRDVIGPGGKTIRSIVESTGVKIDIQDDGTVVIASADSAASDRAIEIIEGLTEEAEIGKIYNGVVKRIADFGAFVEILPGIEGLVHISQLEEGRVEKVTDVVKEGDEIPVRVMDIDRQGRIRLSRKEAMTQ